VKAEEAAPATSPAPPATATDSAAYATEETPPEPAEVADRGSPPEATVDTTAEAGTAEPAEAEASAVEPPKPAAAATEPMNDETRPTAPRPLPPGWFRATPQMMSLVGCSEPEMADVMRGLGYRVHPPSEDYGPLHAFSVKPRFVREREEQRERQRQQDRERRDQRRPRPERPNERQFFADAPRRDGPRDGQKPERRNGPRKDGPREDRPRDERRGPRPPRRDADGPALRLYATTEKKGDPATDSPFAKLLELKLGGKK
jgi:ATP-dependent RNA helicase SUPV3L1/SUV3